MKLRYYLRGLAVGIVLTTLILAIANAGNKPLSDAQIKQRALELGMVEADSKKLSDLQTESTVTKESATKESTTAESATKESTSESASKESSVAESSSVESSVAESSSAESSVAESSSAESSVAESSSVESSVAASSSAESSTAESKVAESSSAQENAGGATTDKAYTLVIKSGASSYTVSKDLAAAGIIADAKLYDDFLCKNGYANKIHIGTYEIVPGMTEEEIAKMIAY